MAHALQLIQAATTIDLAVDTVTGIALSAFHPPSRTPAGPQTVEIVCDIGGTSPDTVDAQLAALNQMLTAAQLFNEQHLGAPVYLLFKRAFETQYAYWVVLAVPVFPVPAGDDDWLDTDTISNRLRISFQVTLEATAHDISIAPIANMPVFAVPITFTATRQALAGNIDIGLHVYAATFVTARGETSIGNNSNAITSIASNQQVVLTAIPTGPTGTTSRKIYRSKAGTSSPFFLLTTLADNTTTTYTDNSTDASLGVGPPTVNTTALANQPGFDTITTDITRGDVPGPVVVQVSSITSAAPDWRQCMIAITAGTPDLFDYAGTADTAAYGGAAVTLTGPSDGTTSSSVTFTTRHRAPLRAMLRLKSMDATKTAQIQARFKIIVSNTTLTGQWVTMPSAASTNYYMLDLGTLNLSSYLFMDAAVSISFVVRLDVQTLDGSATAMRADYLELVPAWSLTKLSMPFGVPAAGSLSYEAVNQSGAFAWTRPNAQSYTATSAHALYEHAPRYGELGQVPPNQTAVFWFMGQSNSAHVLSDTASILIYNLPCYSVGLRGAG